MAEIYYYGERGLIDSLLLDIIHSNKQDKIIRNIVKKINPESKINLKSGSSPFEIYVEPSFGQKNGFGVPDLIIKAKNVINANDELYIIEAKCGTVNGNCYSGEDPNKFWENSSKLNVQLLLRYRFIRLLKESTVINGKYCVYEDKNVYSDESHASKSANGISYQRALGNSDNTSWVKELKDIDLGNIYYVALTSDSKDNKDELKKLKESYKVNFKLSVDEQKKYDGFKNHIKLLTYKEILDIFEELDVKTSFFEKSCGKFHYYELPKEKL